MRKKLKIIVGAVVLIAIVLGAILCNVFDIDGIILRKIYPKKYEDYVQKYSRQNNLDAMLIYSIIKAESNFKSDAQSISGAKGLMQIMDSTAKELQEKLNEDTSEEVNLFDPEKNIMYGTEYYSYLLAHYDNNIHLALAAYNAGMGNVDRWIKEGIINSDGSNIEKIPYKETNMYVRKIINNYEMYKRIYKAR